MSEAGKEDNGSFPRNEWVRASCSNHARYGTIQETYYMLLPQGAMMRTVTTVIEVLSEQTGVPRRAKTTSSSEALCFIPGNYTLKIKRGSEYVVLEPKK